MVSSVEFVANNGITPLKSWLGKFEFYNQNFLSLRLSNKWPILLDPHMLGIEAIQVPMLFHYLLYTLKKMVHDVVMKREESQLPNDADM